MRRIYSLLFLLLLFSITILSAQKESDPGWKQLTASDLFTYHYSSKQIDRTPEGTIKFWVKMAPTVEGIIDEKARNEVISFRQQYHESTKGYAKWRYRLIQYEVHCSQRKFRVLTITDYEGSGRELDSKSNEGGWLDIAPDSLAEDMFDKLCHLK
ncbi:MAG: surface-adhesin E family protein [Pyrinomonadaceae bacterium]